MDPVTLITALLLLLYLAGVWFLGSALQLKSPDIWVLRAGLAIIGSDIAEAFLWWRRSRRATGGEAAAEPIDASNEIDILIRDAESRLTAGLAIIGIGIAAAFLWWRRSR